MLSAPMKHADVSLDGNSLQVHIDDSVTTPVLRPLEEPFQFDPEQPWNVLAGKAYNFQYGWNPGGFIQLPATAWIWIEQLDASPELEVYQRPPALPSYERVLATDGAIWRWPGAMTHNVYAVERPQKNTFEATYRVYVGDEITGQELVDEDNLPVFESTVTSFTFLLELIGDFDQSGVLDAPDIDLLSQRVVRGEYDAVFDLNQDTELTGNDRWVWIEELVGTVPGDADLNGAVEFADFLRLSSAFGVEDAGWADGDFDGDGQVQFADFLVLSQNFGHSGTEVANVPEPSWTPWLTLLASLGLRHVGKRAEIAGEIAP